TLLRIRVAWRTLRRAGQPPLIAASLDRTLVLLTDAVRRRASLRTFDLALDLQQSALDLELRYRPRGAVDRARLALWCQRLRADARAKDPAAVSGDAATIAWIRDRVALNPDQLRPLDTELGRLEAAADGRRTEAAADHAARLIGVL